MDPRSGRIPAPVLSRRRPRRRQPPPGPLSANGCVADPPIVVRSAVTIKPVLVGPDPGVTLTVSNDDPPGRTDEGLAAPVPDGFVVPVQGLNAAPVLRGDGAPVEKSDALLSVSVQPLASRRAAVVFVSAGVAVPSKQLAPPNPMRSITPAVGQAPLNAAVPLTS